VRLLWEENALDAIGAFCVAAFVLGSTWIFLEGALGANAYLAGTVAFAAAVWTLGQISRQRYPERRTFAAQHVPTRPVGQVVAADGGAAEAVRAPGNEEPVRAA